MIDAFDGYEEMLCQYISQTETMNISVWNDERLPMYAQISST